VAKAAAKRAAQPARKAPARVPYYNQTTDFTCGPSSLLMAMKAFDPRIDLSRAHELQVWREATTIFMGGPEHGGCGATGLALAAHRRGFHVEVWVNHRGVLLSERAKDKERAKIMALMQQADLKEMKRLKIPYRIGVRDIDALRRDLAEGALPLVLVNMHYIHDDPTAHWVVVTGIDAEGVTVNDPWISKERGQTRRTQTDCKVPHSDFPAMATYGRRKERATVVLRKRTR